MEQRRETLAALGRRKLKSAVNYGRTFVKWAVIASCIGAVGGLIGAAFHLSVNFATELRGAYGWLLFLMPLGGLAIVWLYRATGMEGKGTNDIIHSIHFGEKVPLMLTPVIFAATVVTHMVGGSAGREGAALQIGGSIGWQVGRLFRRDEREIRVATMCGMSAVFAALFGTPLTAAVFALEVLTVGVFYYMAFIPCLIAALTAYGISLLFRLPPTRFAILEAFDLSLTGVLQVAALAALCALVSIAFCVSMHKTERLLQRRTPNPYLRVLLGSACLIALTLLCGTKYGGAGMETILGAMGGAALPWDWILKIVFTALTLGCGFKGGEIIPSFFIGATFGCFMGGLLGVPASFGAAVGIVAVFCGAVNCPIASIILSVELFGAGEMAYFAIACGVSYMLSGYYGLYRSQEIRYSKLRPEKIEIHAK